MSDYTNSRVNPRSSFPPDAVDAQSWTRLEPVLTPTQLRRRFLMGIPLTSALVNPVTRKLDVITDDDLKDQILRAVSMLEADTNDNINIFPVKYLERQAFDRNLLNAQGHLRVIHSPILSVDRLSISSGQEHPIYTLPNQWVDPAYFSKGLIYFTPLLPATTVAMGGNTVMNTAGAAAFLQYAMQMAWQPALWEIEYTAGFKDAVVPRIVNEAIGCYAAIEVLSELAATNRANTHSLGFDGMSQSVSTPGPEVYNVRIGVLDDKRKKLVNKLRALYGRKMVMDNI